MKPTTFVFPPLLLGTFLGCTVPQYVPPQAVAVAELSVVRAEGSTGGKLFIHLIDGPQCGPKSSVEPLDFNSEQVRRTSIAAQRRTQLLLSEYSSATQSRCDVALDFNAVAGGRYRATWHAEKDRCFVHFETLTWVDGKEIAKKVPSASLNYRRC